MPRKTTASSSRCAKPYPTARLTAGATVDQLPSPFRQRVVRSGAVTALRNRQTAQATPNQEYCPFRGIADDPDDAMILAGKTRPPPGKTRPRLSAEPQK
jgi:hypothetical protein